MSKAIPGEEHQNKEVGRSRKRNTHNAITKNTPQKPYLGMIQGTERKVEVYKDDYGIETLETEENAAIREMHEESGIYLDETKLQNILSETVPSQLEWTT
ncbi:hypothetical protein C2G38_2161856 [Gigaspora rosea]|uniref:Nudix hydrolase domain-containing protein n=1 Tax=Gigaspora rosea TaxID=44941 RepID=A0A397W3W5_9GLOM|nr:hypothetical protein C2G38_2161856 [Gigaspora rosea]